MEPQDDNFTQYNQQLENFLMEEDKDFWLPELPKSNRYQMNDNPSPLQQDHPNQDETMTPTKNKSHDVSNAQPTNSPTENNDTPPGFSYHTAESKNIGLPLSGNSASSEISYAVQAPSPIQPVQWSSMEQTSSLVPPVPAGATSSPNPPPAILTTCVASSYSNPSTHQPQPNNPSPTPPPIAASSNMTHLHFPSQAPCNNNTLQATTIAANYHFPPPSINNDILSQQSSHCNNYGLDELAPNDSYQYGANQQVATDNAGSSSAIASRFAAAAQGASLGNMRTQYSLPYDPSGFMNFARPNSVSTDLSTPQRRCGAYVQGGTQVDDAGGYGTQAVPFHQQMAVAAAGGGGGLETGLLSMYSSATFHELALMAQRSNNLASMKKQQQKEGAAAKPRGRPKGSVTKKRNPPPQWEEAEYDMQETVKRAKKPYINARRAKWQDMKLAGAIPRPQMMSSFLGDQMTFRGQAASWNNYPSICDNQGQNGDLQAVGSPNPSNHTPLNAMEANPNPNLNHVHHQPSEAVHLVPQRQGSNMTSFGDATLVENPSKFWSFGTNNQPGTMSFPSKSGSNNKKQTIENLIQSSSAPEMLVLQAAPSQINSYVEFGTPGSSPNVEHQSQATNSNNNNSVNVGGMRSSFSNSDSHESTMERQAVAEAANNQFRGGGYQSNDIHFINGCFGVVVATQETAQDSDGSCNKQTMESTNATSTQTTALESNNINPSMNQNTSVPEPMPPCVVAADPYPISVSDYFNEYDGMQLSDEDYIVCALREQVVSKATAQPTQQQQVTPQPTQLSSHAHHPVPSSIVEQEATAQQNAQAPATVTIPLSTAGQQVSIPRVSQTNTSSEQLGQQAANKMSGKNNQQQAPNVPPPQNPSAQYQPVEDGSSSVHHGYIQQYFTSNSPASAYQGSSLQVPAYPTGHQTERPQNMPRISGPTDLYYYQQNLQQQQQQANSSVNGQRSYAMPPPPRPQYQAAPGFTINRPLTQRQFYLYGGTGNVSPPLKTPRRCRQNAQPAAYPVIDFNQCAVTPTMFNEIVDDGSVDSIIGSDLWAGLNQDIYNIMVMTDRTLLLDPVRLEERIAQINSGMLPIPNILNAIRMNAQQAAGFSVPPAANRLVCNSNTMNYPTSHQGHELAAVAVNCNFTDPNAGVPNVQNKQTSNNLQNGSQMNGNMEQGQPNFRYWHEYSAPPSSGQRPEDMQLVPMNQPSILLTSAQNNENQNTPFRSAPASVIPYMHHAAPPNTMHAPNQAYNNTMYGVPYAPGGTQM